MDPIVPAAVRASGAVSGALLGRNRSVGVARIGSAEDRAQAYYRFMEAAQTCTSMMFDYFLRRVEATHPSPLRQPLWRLYRHWCAENARTRLRQAQVELQVSFMAIQLCAPPLVREAAEEVMQSLPRFEERPDDYMSVIADHTVAQADFIAAARRDLAYNPKPWQFLKKWRERRYQKQVKQRFNISDSDSVPKSAQDLLRILDEEKRQTSTPLRDH